ncbi:class I SAM-dependent methyltransferase [soil metagenome]
MDKSKQAVEVFNLRAEGYMEKFMDVSLYGESFDFFCDATKKQQAQVLEVACGPGNITRYLLNKRPDFRILGIDLAPKMLELATKNNPAAKFQLLDGREINKLQKKYDAIMCGFCFPYFSKEEAIKFIADAKYVLNKNGILYISTMENDYEKSGLQKGSAGDEIYIHYHEEKYLKDALLKNDFSFLKTERIGSIMGNGEAVTDLILIAQKN